MTSATRDQMAARLDSLADDEDGRYDMELAVISLRAGAAALRRAEPAQDEHERRNQKESRT